MWLDTNPTGSKDPGKKLYVYFYDPNRKTTRKIVTKFYNKYPDKNAARRFLKKMEADAEDNKFIFNFPFVGDVPLFSSAYEKFINSRIAKPKTLSSYNCAEKIFINILGDKRLDEYCRQDGINLIKAIQKHGLARKKALSANSIASYTKQLKIIWDWIIEEIPEAAGLRNPIRAERKVKTIVKTIPPDDLRIIFEYFRGKITKPA